MPEEPLPAYAPDPVDWPKENDGIGLRGIADDGIGVRGILVDGIGVRGITVEGIGVRGIGVPGIASFGIGEDGITCLGMPAPAIEGDVAAILGVLGITGGKMSP